MSLAAVLAQLPQAEFVRPAIDWHAVAPELVLLAAGALLTLIDIVGLERSRRYAASLTGLAFLLPLVPIATLAIDGIGGEPRSLFGGARLVRHFDGGAGNACLLQRQDHAGK